MEQNNLKMFRKSPNILAVEFCILLPCSALEEDSGTFTLPRAALALHLLQKIN
jgi:hypothetical protein